MKVIYSNQPLANLEKKSIFLLGGTPRSKDVPSWRPAALKILENNNFDGTVCVPEPENGERFPNYDVQINWELHHLENCGKIVAWVPRNMENMLCLTTNIELGYWLAKSPERVIYGRPDGTPHTNYLDFLYKREHKHIGMEVAPVHTLEDLILAAIISLGLKI